jgi:hypothetical protein
MPLSGEWRAPKRPINVQILAPNFAFAVEVSEILTQAHTDRGRTSQSVVNASELSCGRACFSSFPSTVMSNNGANSSSSSWFSRLFKPSSSGMAVAQADDDGAVREQGSTTFLEKLKSFGLTVFHGMEAAGEVLVDWLGLEDSMFQEVYDNMTEEEMAYATEVDRQRNEEDATHAARLAGPNLGSMEGGAVELEDVNVDLKGGSGYAVVQQPSLSTAGRLE